MVNLKRIRIGEIEFLRISRDAQFHFIWNVSLLGEFKNEAIHFVDLDDHDFDFDDENVFKVTNVDDSLIALDYLILDIDRL